MSRPVKNKPTKTKRYNFDLDGALFQKFQEACESRLTTPTIVFRHFVKTYVEEFVAMGKIEKQLSGKSGSRKKS
jgi:hypothetical protein